MVYRIEVDSVEDAVRLAEERKDAGLAHWFRGQAKEWRVHPTFVRLTLEKRERALERLNNFDKWVRQAPGLESLAESIESVTAVAQHYGLPTTFLDFTTEPKIAGFFASEKAGSATTKDMACIFCLNEEDEDLRILMQIFTGDSVSLRLWKNKVPDLWRLEAQHGGFLCCPCEDIEADYSFDRILFPNTHPLRTVKREDVFPVRKSQLEDLLDRYFMVERNLIKSKMMWSLPLVNRLISEVPIAIFGVPSVECHPLMFPDGIPDHPSWSDATLQPWLELRDEEFAKVQSSVVLQVHLPRPPITTDTAKTIAEHLLADITDRPGIRGKLVGWDIQSVEDYDLPEDFAYRIEPKLARLWDGLRRLPYTDEDVCLGLGMCVAFAMALRGNFRNTGSGHLEQASTQCLGKSIELEFGAHDGSYSRGYASWISLAEAVRPDILSYVSEEKRGAVSNNIRLLLLGAQNPQKVFDFHELTRLFAREIAPTQVLLQNWDSACFYSPAHLDGLGLQ